MQQPHKGVLRELLNLYLYDLSHLADADPSNAGRFEYKYLDHYWTEDGRYAFFIKSDDTLAGFVMVRAHAETDADHSISEFFVLNRHRGKGVAMAAARAAFERFRGAWEVCTDADNIPAIGFWRHVIDRITGGAFEERPGINGWSGPMFLFKSP